MDARSDLETTALVTRMPSYPGDDKPSNRQEIFGWSQVSSNWARRGTGECIPDVSVVGGNGSIVM